MFFRIKTGWKDVKIDKVAQYEVCLFYIYIARLVCIKLSNNTCKVFSYSLVKFHRNHKTTKRRYALVDIRT